ncbi:MAG TPA: response regulator [Candidatus Acidoferrales bacterium]|jgi:YesN/AraC family two-component response regulator|nr:response regulator [Candidatus Acidoferrales bacterium]
MPAVTPPKQVNDRNIRKRLLFVDDEQSIRVTLPPILAENGFEVTSVANAADAIFEIQNSTFEVLLSDLNLPQASSGLIVIEQMRKSQPGCVNFILTGFPADESFKRATEHDVAHYFVKPVDVEELLRTIKSKIEARHVLPETETTPKMKYPWQQAVLDAFMEFRPQYLPGKVNAAERAIDARLCDANAADLDERMALRDALRSLHVLFPGAEPKKEREKKKGVA